MDKSMWASKTDYAKLYSPEYFGKSSGSASYNGSDFERVFFNLCKANNIDSLVDVGSGSGKLKQSAVSAGMTVFSCDFDPVDKDAFHFDLSLEDAEAAATLYNQIGDRVGSAEYITTCLDVLEHIDIEDVSNALWNLHTIIGNLAVVSVSTRPSSRGNKYHSTVLPLSTWKYLFELSGFEIVDPHFCSEGRRILPPTSNDPLLGLVSHWAQADIFKDRLDGEPTYLLLRKAKRPTDKESRLIKIDAVLDIAYRKEKRLAFHERRLQAIALNIGHFQDFLTLRPLLDIIPRGQCSALIRGDELQSDEMSMIVGHFERNGIPIIIYRTVAEIDWRGLSVRTLVSGSESTAAVSHALNAQVIEAAKLWGVKTVLLQHGIWIEPMQDREINFASDTILAWGAEHERFSSGKHSAAGISRSYSALNNGRFKAAGSPKFHDSLLQTNSDVLRWRLGIDISNYSEHVLLGTNLKWAQHHDERLHILAGIRRMIQSNPEKLFIVKPHPSERHSEYAELRADNTLVLDDILLGCLDLSVSRLLGGIATVVSSLSTLLLDGAVLGRRCIQYDTGNRLHYELCKPISVNDLHLAIKNPLAASLSSKDFASYYNDAGNDHFYEVFAEVVGDQSSSGHS
ncbi:MULTISPECIES: hypothetical protein [Rhizobium]|uniref:hypothetical protein n=1 Tax=Rhizobium TaxID=379 RepID=UPI00119FDFF3|nr:MULTISPECIES: hypothetical protein [Rhizobium]MCZ3380156.1 hypothetical protein [Rhizobium sp. AG207R]